MNTKGSGTYISQDDLEKIINYLNSKGKHRLVFLFKFGTRMALRIGDLKQIRWRDVLGKDRYKVDESKTGKRRDIIFSPQCKEIIQQYYEILKPKRVTDYIFCNKLGKPYSTRYLNAEFKRIIRNSRIENPAQYKTHSLRKTWGRRVWENNGESDRALTLICYAFGHSNPRITMAYLGIRQDEIDKLYYSYENEY